MALFGPKDKSLPLLTQFYQVEEGNIAEMDLFVSRWRGGSEPFGMTKNDDQGKPVTRLHALTRRLMNSLVKGTVQAGDIWEFNGFWKNNGREFVFKTREADYDSFHQTFSTEVRDANDLDMARWHHHDPWRQFETEVVQEVGLLLRQAGKKLTTCTECKSVHVSSRSGQRFCSHRCAERSGVRARRRAKKILSEVQSDYRNPTRDRVYSQI